MSSGLVVRPDKNEFLLYSMLDSLGLARGKSDTHFLRRKTYDNFKGYTGLGLKQEEYIHHSKPATYVLTLNEAPDFREKTGLILDSIMEKEIEYGRVVLPHLKHFYQNTDFEDFYQKILPRYNEECEFLEGIFNRANLSELLDSVWELDKPINMEVIPMPLEGTRSGVGPSIGDIAYSIVGPPFDYSLLHNVAHEGSHPRAKKILEPISKDIEDRKNLLKLVQKQSNYPKSYNHWQTCFEEHFIRAMQAGYIDNNFNRNLDINLRLQNEEKENGMLFIRDFYNEIKKHKENKKGTLTEVGLKILERLDKTYRAQLDAFYYQYLFK